MVSRKFRSAVLELNQGKREKYVHVGIPLPVDGLYAYRAVGDVAEKVRKGSRVLVPYGRRRITGIAFSIDNAPPEQVALKDVEEVLDGEGGDVVPESLLKLALWTAGYYQAPLGEVVSVLLSHGRFRESRLFVCKGERFREFLSSDEKEEKLRQALSRRGRVTLRYASETVGISRSRLRKLEIEGFIKVEERELRRGKVPLFHALKAIEGKEGDASEGEMEIYQFVRRRTIALASEVFAHFGASGLKKAEKLLNKGLLQALDLDRPLSSSGEIYGPRVPFTQYQKRALEEIERGINSGRFSTYLLYGVTGSGKTEVYLESAKKVLEKGRSVILLFPEIALAGHLLARIKMALGKVAVLHSGLTRTERTEYFERILRGEYRVVVGVRSAVFAPLKNVGLIVVDEEHDSSYKQTEGVRYHARDVAVMRGKIENAVVILGSATPSLESYSNAIKKKYVLLKMPERVQGELPAQVEVIRMKPKEDDLISSHLRDAVQEALSSSHQALILTHRRGYAPFQICEHCSFVWKCLNCDVSLTYHRSKGALICHYCGYTVNAHQPCPECGQKNWIYRSFGTERVEEFLKDELPLARIARLDSDVASKRGEADRILARFERGEIDVLVGTQMVAKGLDIPRLEVIGVISADTLLNLPDFRAPERGFQLLKQVLGRAGRREGVSTRVIIQTFQPWNRIIRYVAEGDDEMFYTEEMARRRELHFPPFHRLAVIIISSGELARAEKVAGELYSDLTRRISPHVEVLGPSPSPFFLLRGAYRYQIFLKAESAKALLASLSAVRLWSRKLPSRAVKIEIDVDPVSVL